MTTTPDPTPVTTDFVRRHYAKGPTAYRPDGSIAKMPDAEDVAYCERQFDEWLARHDDEVRAALSTPPADDLRELIDHLNGLMDSLDESVSHDQVYEQLRVAWNMALALRPGVPTPPADDVREALAREIEPTAWTEVHPHPTVYADEPEARALYEAYFHEGQRDRRAPSLAIADRLLSSRTFEVRPHGTVTPTVDEWSEQMDAERARQIEHGYDDAHDAEHGAARGPYDGARAVPVLPGDRRGLYVVARGRRKAVLVRRALRPNHVVRPGDRIECSGV